MAMAGKMAAIADMVTEWAVVMAEARAAVMAEARVAAVTEDNL